MERERFLECLAADAARLRAAAARDVAAAVPHCPGWTVTDLVQHVATVYLHKVECMRTGVPPSPWPPPGLAAEAPLALFDRAYDELWRELTERDPAAPAYAWYEPDQTVGFWVRRMAHETVIHRVDAEQAAGEAVAAVPADLAADGVDEVLTRFLAYDLRDGVPDDLPRPDGRAVAVAVGGARWLTVLDPTGVRVEPDTAGQAAAQVSGDPESVLLWLWGRAGDEAVRIDGDPTLISHFRAFLVAATQ
ncbi:maleylpyruvate isomerase family mycothiol-dependent enzyme [Actinomycetes bacterium KLBMP 9797]